MSAMNGGMVKGFTKIQWKIQNISYWCREVHGDYILSPQFGCIKAPAGYILKLGLFPKGQSNGDQRMHVQLKVCQLNFAVPLDFELLFVESNGNPLRMLTATNRVIEEGTPFYGPVDPTSSEDFQSRRSSFIKDDTLTMVLSLCQSGVNDSVSEYVFARTCIEVRETCILFPTKIFTQIALNQEMTVPLLLSVFPEKSVSLKWTQCLIGTSLEHSVFNFKITRPENEERLLLKFRICLLTAEKEITHRLEETCIFGAPAISGFWYFTETLRRQSVLGTDNFVVSVSVVATSSHTTESISKIINAPAYVPVDILGNDST